MFSVLVGVSSIDSSFISFRHFTWVPQLQLLLMWNSKREWTNTPGSSSYIWEKSDSKSHFNVFLIIKLYTQSIIYVHQLCFDITPLKLAYMSSTLVGTRNKLEGQGLYDKSSYKFHKQHGLITKLRMLFCMVGNSPPLGEEEENLSPWQSYTFLKVYMLCLYILAIILALL